MSGRRMAASEGFLGWLKGLDEGYRHGLADNVTRLTNQVPIVASRGAVIDASLHEVLANRLSAEAAREGFNAADLEAIKAKLMAEKVDVEHDAVFNSLDEFKAVPPEQMASLLGMKIHEEHVDQRPGPSRRRALYDYAQNGPDGPTVIPGALEGTRNNLKWLLESRAGAYGVPAALVGAPVALSMLTSDDAGDYIRAE